MRYLLAVLLVAIPLTAAVYAQYRLAFHTPNFTQLWLTRLLLLSVGLGLGWAMAFVYLPVEGAQTWLVFLSAFGVAHIPAAIILFLKKHRQRQLERGR